jgi:hypothetical protein
MTNKEKMWEFHKLNPHVYERFEELTLLLINRGYKQLSSKGMFEFMRIDYMIKTSGSSFKLDNNFTPYYARFFEYNNPNHKGIFIQKQTKL